MGLAKSSGTVAMYECIKAAGEAGARPADVHAADTTGRSRLSRQSSLQQMRKSGYIRFEGQRQEGRWHLGDKPFKHECGWPKRAASAAAAAPKTFIAPAPVAFAAPMPRVASVWDLAKV